MMKFTEQISEHLVIIKIISIMQNVLLL